MTLPVWNGTAADESSGDLTVLVSPTVTVTDKATGAKPSLFSDRAGNTGIGNPFTANADGSIEFYVAPGRYKIVADDGAGNTATWDNQLIGIGGTEAVTRNVASLTDMQALSAGEYATVYMRGRTTEGDGGEGHFRWDSSNLSTEVGNDEVTNNEGDGGIYVAPSSDKTGASGAWVRQFSGAVNVRWYGAKGDGATDDEPSFTAAISGLPAEGGTILLGKLGDNFLLKSAVAINKTVHMIGHGHTDQSSTTPATQITKDDALSATLLPITGKNSVLEHFTVKGESGNGGDGIGIEAGRVSLRHVSVFDQGGDGIRIGNAAGVNANIWRLFDVITRSNGSNGVNCDDGKDSQADVNAGVCVGLETSSNTADGLNVGNALFNDWINVTAQGNGGNGVHFQTDSEEQRLFGGDQNEGNTVNQILNEGTGNSFTHHTVFGFVDNGTKTAAISSKGDWTVPMSLGIEISPAGDNRLAVGSGFAGTETIAKFENRGNAAADRGFSIDHELPVSGGSAVGVRFISARAGTSESSYYAIQVKRDGVALADSFMLIASGTAGTTWMSVYDVDSGSLQRVKVGANGTGPGGVGRALYLDDV